MKDHHVKLTETDREILKSYSTMLEGLSMYLGEGYELVLHSLEDYSSSAVKSNSWASHRKNRRRASHRPCT